MNQTSKIVIRQLIDILNETISYIKDDSDMVWTQYETPRQLRQELLYCVNQLENNELPDLDKLDLLFAPTSTLQEHAISNGWGGQYIMISERFDVILSVLKL